MEKLQLKAQHDPCCETDIQYSGDTKGEGTVFELNFIEWERSEEIEIETGES